MSGKVQSGDLHVPGGRLRLKIEAVFQTGIVVSFADSEGVEYRGVLLRETSPFHSRSPNYTLANPLSLLHDHPYAEMKGNGQKVTKTVPTSALLQWNSVPLPLSQVPALPGTPQSSPILNGINSRTSFRAISLATMSNNNYFYSKCAIVETLRMPEEELGMLDSAYPSFVPGIKRRAKVLATLKMRTPSCTSSVRSPASRRSLSRTQKAREKSFAAKQRRYLPIEPSRPKQTISLPMEPMQNTIAMEAPHLKQSITSPIKAPEPNQSAVVHSHRPSVGPPGEGVLKRKPRQRLLLKNFSICVEKVLLREKVDDVIVID